ncbi:hypothetical protein [Sphingomonas crocodyli]|uniref:Uncharacterized protein n=1 Tax=Sphingomonas crocodyli TaxID=1979270 RepID=A0A437M5N3_9SPHN|nr:hypothetical protein [Sphingomonas crocodyli]RVT92982.1 hypothetical protein EOD43_03495 [Sphingomonas crocodyli]
MTKYLTLAAFGWLTLTGTLHFAVDVVSHHLRGKHVPGPQTTLYYGLHSAFALGQVLFGMMCLWTVRRHPDMLRDPAIVMFSVAGAGAWLALTVLVMDYWEPKLNAGIFAVLLAVAIAAEHVRA